MYRITSNLLLFPVLMDTTKKVAEYLNQEDGEFSSLKVSEDAIARRLKKNVRLKLRRQKDWILIEKIKSESTHFKKPTKAKKPKKKKSSSK